RCGPLNRMFCIIVVLKLINIVCATNQMRKKNSPGATGAFSQVQIFPDILDILFEGFSSPGGQFADGVRIVTLEGFDDLDITRLLQPSDLVAQISLRSRG